MTIEEYLYTEGEIAYWTRGTSMLPMLRENKDVVIIRAKRNDRAQRYDVALYRRPGQSHYVLHRVLRQKKDGYIMRGDNQWRKEFVPEADVIGILTAFIRDGREISVEDPDYQAYVKKQCRPLQARRLRMIGDEMKSRLKRIYKRYE